MTEKQYHAIRSFALKSLWNDLYDSWGGPYADKATMSQHILDTVRTIDKTFGDTPHRNNITLAVDVVDPPVQNDTPNVPDSPITILRALWQKINPPNLSMISTTEEPMQPNDTAHSWRNSLSHFAFKTTSSGLELIGSVVHEGEHANQSDKSRYTTDELRLIAIFRAVNCSPEQNYPYYQCNPNEMAARLQEAKIYLEIFEHAQKDPLWDMNEREFFMHKFHELNTRLMKHVGRREIDVMIDNLVKGLKTTSEFCDVINTVFDGKDSHECNVAAAHFLDTTGRALHQALCSELCSYSDKLSKAFKRLERETKPELDRNNTIKQDRRKNIIRRLTEENIPMVDISQMNPFPQNSINVEYDDSKLESAIQLAKLYHNAAFTQTSEGLCVVYDTEPCVRPYGPPSPPPITPETTEEEHKTQRVNNDARHVDVLEVDEWDNFDEP